MNVEERVALSRANAAVRLEVTPGRINHYLKYKCPVTNEVELESPQGIPVSGTRESKRSIYEDSIIEFESRHTRGPVKGSWLHERVAKHRAPLVPPQYSMQPQAAVTENPRFDPAKEAASQVDVASIRPLIARLGELQTTRSARDKKLVDDLTAMVRVLNRSSRVAELLLPKEGKPEKQLLLEEIEDMFRET
jgi:hypothetical protein